VILSLGGEWAIPTPIVYADGGAIPTPGDADLRALGLFVAEASREVARVPGGDEPATFRLQIDAAERDILRRALDQQAWNVSGAARRLDISRQHVHNLLNKHDLRRR
jgi:transcriptional regulator of acetoin/glycerol metabolism